MKRWLIIVLVVLIVVAAASLQLWNPVSVPIRVKHPPNDDPWLLVSYDPDNPYGTYLGNGFISTRIMGDGVGSQDGKPLPCYMAGFYDNEKLIPIPTWSDLRFYDGKTRFKIDKTADYKQVLNMKTGILTTHATWRAGRKTLKGKIEVIVSRGMPHFAMVKAEFIPNFDGHLDVKASGLGEASAKATSSGLAAGCYSQVWCDPEIRTGKRAEAGVVVCLALGKTVTDAINAARTEFVDANEFDAGSARTENWIVGSHKAAWAKLWKKDIIIDGPAKDQQAIHSCMFYLLQSVREGSQWSIPPMGLSNDSFGGHIFWDADLWMFPALILQHPELARSIVDYRYNTLPGAMENAKTDGYKGAQYAWESGYTGKEDTPPGLVYRHERHINGDIALAQWQYYLATGDLNWLKTRGFPILKATADYWVSRATYNAAKKRYEILKVVPPDENVELVDNSAYTNAIAKMNLEFAVRAAELIHAAPNPKWSEVAGKMYIPFDAKAKRFIAFDSYKGVKRSRGGKEVVVYPQAKQADTELIIYPLQFKIPDQNMTDIYRNTFRFYQPKVLANGPAMSSSAHAVIAARLGDCSGVYKYWRKSYAPFLRGPFNYFNEKQSKTWDQMCFLTGAAGPIQSALFGLAGIRMEYWTGDSNAWYSYGTDDTACPGNGLVVSAPCLPKQWKSLKVTGLTWRGKTFDLLIKPGKKPELVTVSHGKP